MYRLTERQCGRLLAECGLDMQAGLGLGDVHILFHQLSKSSCITYDGLAQLYRCALLPCHLSALVPALPLHEYILSVAGSMTMCI